jgi:hypothetical protein
MKPFTTTADFLAYVHRVRMYTRSAYARYRTERYTLAGIKGRLARQRQSSRLLRAWLDYYTLREYLNDLLRGLLN